MGVFTAGIKIVERQIWRSIPAYGMAFIEGDHPSFNVAGTAGRLKPYVIFNATDTDTASFVFPVPRDVKPGSDVTFEAQVMIATPHATQRYAQLSFDHQAVSDGDTDDAALGGPENSGDLELVTSGQIWNTFSWTASYSSLGWAADDEVLGVLSRIDPTGSENTSDLYLRRFRIGFVISVGSI